MKRNTLIFIANATVLAAALDASGTAQAAIPVTSLLNGGFETTTNGSGQLGYNTEASGWTTTGYNFLFTPGSADTTGANGEYGNLQLWGPNNGSANGLPPTSPDGGDFIALDGDYQTEALTQTLTGLTVGKHYTVDFDYAFAQQQGFYGDTMQNLTVGFGADPTYTTPTYSLSSQGFSGWFNKSVTFVADGVTDTLSFLAYGDKPVPPFALLSDVTLAAPTPEPASWALMIAGVAGIGISARRRRAAIARGSLAQAPTPA
jgi:hypothetical protein